MSAHAPHLIRHPAASCGFVAFSHDEPRQRHITGCSSQQHHIRLLLLPDREVLQAEESLGFVWDITVRTAYIHYVGSVQRLSQELEAPVR